MHKKSNQQHAVLHVRSCTCVLCMCIDVRMLHFPCCCCFCLKCVYPYTLFVSNSVLYSYPALLLFSIYTYLICAQFLSLISWTFTLICCIYVYKQRRDNEHPTQHQIVATNHFFVFFFYLFTFFLFSRTRTILHSVDDAKWTRNTQKGWKNDEHNDRIKTSYTYTGQQHDTTTTAQQLWLPYEKYSIWNELSNDMSYDILPSIFYFWVCFIHEKSVFVALVLFFCVARIGSNSLFWFCNVVVCCAYIFWKNTFFIPNDNNEVCVIFTSLFSIQSITQKVTTGFCAAQFVVCLIFLYSAHYLLSWSICVCVFFCYCDVYAVVFACVVWICCVHVM